MKHTLLQFSAMLLAAAFFCSCSKDSSNIVGTNVTPFRSVTSKSSAHPALTYIGSYTKGSSGGNTWNTVAVMDTDGTHQTNVLIASIDEGLGDYFEFPRWSPTGGSIAYIEQNFTRQPWTWVIKAVDVTVSSSGTPVGSNTRTIYSTTTD